MNDQEMQELESGKARQYTGELVQELIRLADYQRAWEDEWEMLRR